MSIEHNPRQVLNACDFAQPPWWTQFPRLSCERRATLRKWNETNLSIVIVRNINKRPFSCGREMSSSSGGLPSSIFMLVPEVLSAIQISGVPIL